MQGLLRVVSSTVLVACCHVFSPADAEDGVSFSRDVLPILSTRCFACHGPDAAQRQAELRLDLETDAKLEHSSGVPVVPKDPDGSTMLSRINSEDSEEVMPPPETGQTVSVEERKILREWIAQGAVWGKHWAFEAPVRPEVPRNGTVAIDLLVKKKLADHGLQLSPQADAWQRVRRLYLDLTGLPPTPKQAEQFANNPGTEQWNALIDALLERPEFGEHWARMWMDLARYADTKGYEKDRGRTMWPWRDWLVQQLNQDRPLNELTRELLAGDLLPAATVDQRLATAFHRNTMSNDEGGTDNEEFRTLAVKDRVDSTLQIWMGLTAGCARCHSHKYDPLTQEEYYGLYAIFNQTADADRPDDAPLLSIPGDERRLRIEELEQSIGTLKSRLEHLRNQLESNENDHWTAFVPQRMEAQGHAKMETGQAGVITVSGPSPERNDYLLESAPAPGSITALRIQALIPDGQKNAGVGRNPGDPNFVLSELLIEIIPAEGSPRSVAVQRAKADFSQRNWPVQAAFDGDLKTGWAVSPQMRQPHAAVFLLKQPLTISEGDVLRLQLQQRYGNSLTMRCFRISVTGESAEVAERDLFAPGVREAAAELAQLENQLKQLRSAIPRVPVMEELARERNRETRLHVRGNFLDPGEPVMAGFPKAFPIVSTVAADGPDRLDVADWLMADSNPLTARVWANRIWARLMGQGIVTTEEDFGTMGATPSHPELLDLLAVEYRDNGWSLRQLLRMICRSEVYQQSSTVTAEHRLQDPENRLLARAGRFRLSAEAIRDQLLAVSGLLSLHQGGPPVMPPQPAGLWRSTYNSEKWVNAEGDNRYRRSLYTYLKRTTPYPALTTFDAGSGEFCMIRRIRTNTPLQALVMLNDQTAVEAAGALAERMLAQPQEHRLTWGMQQALIRPVSAEQTEPLQMLLDDVMQEFEAAPESAAELLRNARAEVAENQPAAELAAMVVVAGAILNQDEFLTRH